MYTLHENYEFNIIIEGAMKNIILSNFITYFIYLGEKKTQYLDAQGRTPFNRIFENGF